MFEAIADSALLDATLEPMHAVVEEARIHLDEDELWSKAVDPANVAMGEVRVQAEAFESYDADGGLLGVNLGRLDNMLAVADDDLVQLQLDAETRKLAVHAGGFEGTIAAIDPDSMRSEPEMPDLDLPLTATVEGTELARAVTAADLVSDHIAFGYDPDDGLYADAEGDTDDVYVELATEEVDEAPDETVESLFSLDYMQELVKPMPDDDGETVTVRLGDEFPTIMEYGLEDGAVDATAMLAPRIQS